MTEFEIHELSEMYDFAATRHEKARADYKIEQKTYTSGCQSLSAFKNYLAACKKFRPENLRYKRICKSLEKMG